ncbi:MAG: HAD-IC family P-type ATPase, partial [Rhodobacteraceae bacterium]|nr:HAD-IC family P-type ATPase [Paracoccaceae bacterium]
LRPGAAEAVAGLARQGKRVILISGDAPAAVAAFARRLGIAEAAGGVGPAGKAAAVAALAAAGRRVLMVGDGLNDTAALAAAHVSIAPASALDAARAAADIVLMGESLAPVAEAAALARRARARMRENLALSALYNLVAVPVALAGFATPLAAALAMSSSSLTVSLNALRLGRGGAR